MMKYSEKVEKLLVKVDGFEKKLIEYGKQIIDPGSYMFPVDQYTIGIINRMLSIGSGLQH